MRKNKILAGLLCSTLTLSSVMGGTTFTTVKAAEITNVETTEDTTNYEQLTMPIISITTDENQEITSKEEYVSAQIDVVGDGGEIQLDNMAVSVRLRGNATLNAPKKSYKLKFDKKQNLLNLGDGKGKTWALVANHYDTSMLRNFAAYKMGDMLNNMPYTPNCRSVEVYVNGSYNGVYLLCELANVNKNRVNIAEEVDQVEQNGYLLEMTRYTSEESFKVDTSTYDIKSDLSENEEIREQQVSYIKGYLENAIQALKEGNKDEIATYIDIDSLVDMYIGNEIVKNVDAGWDSFYLSKDADGTLVFGPMWDFDLALGNTDCVKGFDYWQGFSPYTILNVNANANPWLCYAMENDWFRQMVTERWNEVVDELETIPDMLLEEVKSNNASYLRNFTKWDVLGTQVYTEPHNIAELATYQEHVEYLANWIENRINWLDENYNTDDFQNGILRDEEGEVLSASGNIMKVSSILPLAWGLEATTQVTKNTGMIVDASASETGGGMVMMLVTGFMLEEGAEYELSFDYSSTKEVSTSFAIQENFGSYNKYMERDITLTSETQHYTTTFVSSATESNTAFALNLRGSDVAGGIVVLDNMSLVKKTTQEEENVEEMLTVTLDVVEEWTSGATCNITVTNNSEADLTDGWTVEFDLNREIQNLWCANLESSESGHYVIKNPSWNTTLKAGESYTFGFTVGAGEEVVMSNTVVK